MNNYPYRRGRSPIHGIGVFATQAIRKGDLVIMPSFIDDGYDVFHGFNHSCDNNLGPHEKLGKYRRAQRNIKVGEELTCNYGVKGKCKCEVCNGKVIR